MLSDRCPKCRQLTTEFVLKAPEESNTIFHYETFVDLDASAETGCSSCRLLRRALIHSGSGMNLTRNGTDINMILPQKKFRILSMNVEQGGGSEMTFTYDSKSSKQQNDFE